jgi:hypothetical protein
MRLLIASLFVCSSLDACFSVVFVWRRGVSGELSAFKLPAAVDEPADTKPTL